MNNCPNCNAELEKGALSCESCGYEFESIASHSAKKNFKHGRLLTIAIPVVAVILAVAIFLISMSSSTEASYANFGYFRDGELFLSDFSAGAGDQVSEDFKEKNVLFSNYKDYVRMSNDGKKIFYVDNFDGSSYKLYYKNTSDLNKAYKISSGIIIYDISDDGSIVTYTKNNGSLHQHNLSEQSDAIDVNVINYLVSDDGNTIVYQKRGEGDNSHLYDVYVSKNGKQGEKILSSVSSVKHVSEDFTTLYYISDNTLYRVNIGKTPKKLAENIRDVIAIYETGEMYFTKANESGEASLYYFNGKKASDPIFNNFYRTESASTEKPVLAVYDSNNIERPFNIVIKDKSYIIDYDVSSITMNDAGTEIYFTAGFDVNTKLSKLYTAKIDNGLTKVKKVSDGVTYGKHLSGEKFIYVKDYDTASMVGTICVDGEEVAKNVNFNTMKYNKADGSILYFSDVIEGSAKLYRYKNGKSQLIHESVFMNSLNVAEDGHYVFIADYYKTDGILYCANGEKLEKVDHDISETFLIVSNDEYDAKARVGF